MSFGHDAIEALRLALAVTPENLPLRLHLAQSLMNIGWLEEAEQEYRTALRQAAESVDAKVGLAECYVRPGKTSAAMVILEDLIERDSATGSVHVLCARLLLQRGETANAVAQYKLALEKDPEVEDRELAERLGIVPEEQASEVFEGRVREPWQAAAPGVAAEVEHPELTFRDVGGMEPLKEEIAMKIILPLRHPEMYRAYGKAIGGGILMYGPPGCGKTYLARATAGEISAGFIAVGINDVLDMWMGNSERNLHELFEQARSHKPCVLFFDEVDALGARRSDMQTGAGRQLINQFLAEMDGIDASNEGVLVLAATNAPWHMDPAFRRPGRFDRVLFVPPPDQPARAEILRLHCRGKPAGNIDFDYLAAKTDGFSGADLRAVVDMAVEAKLREALRSGVPKPLTTKDLLTAAKRLNPSSREWFSTARNYALYSNQGGLYDDILKYLKLT